MELKQQFKSEEEYVPAQIGFKNTAWLFTALRGPDDSSEAPKEFGTCIIRHAVGFEYGIVCNPRDVHDYLMVMKEAMQWSPKNYRPRELVEVPQHYCVHMRKAFDQLIGLSNGQDLEYYRILRELWNIMIRRTVSDDSRKPLIMAQLEVLWDFLETANYLDED